MFGTFYVERIILAVKKQAHIKHFNGRRGGRDEDPSSIGNS